MTVRCMDTKPAAPSKQGLVGGLIFAVLTVSTHSSL